jgi:hypothetical protein
MMTGGSISVFDSIKIFGKEIAKMGGFPAQKFMLSTFRLLPKMLLGNQGIHKFIPR